jgi:hypothetical protein
MLYQSVGSSACAISAVGNLLLLYGIPCSHEDSRALFRSPAIKKRPIVTHPMLLKVVGRCLSQSSLAWRRHSTFSFDRLRHALKQTVSVGAPALLTFHMRHARRDWAGVHCVVVVAVNEAGIHVIDTLGRRDGRWPNATISPKQSPLGWRVKGAPLILTSGPAYILQGLPPLPKNRRDTHEDRA